MKITLIKRTIGVRSLVLYYGHDPKWRKFVVAWAYNPKSLYMAAKKRKRAGPTPFAKILRNLMTEKGMSVRKAADLANVGISTIDNWRAGALPEDYSAVKRLAKGLGVSLSFILTGEEETNHAPTITEVFDDGGTLFDGYAKINIQRLIPRKKKET